MTDKNLTPRDIARKTAMKLGLYYEPKDDFIYMRENLQDEYQMLLHKYNHDLNHGIFDLLNRTVYDVNDSVTEL